MRGCTPCEETLETVLEDKDYTNPVALLPTSTRYWDSNDIPSIESAEIVGHQGKRKARSVYVFRRTHVGGQVQLFDLFFRYDLLQEPAPAAFSTPCFY